MKSNYVDVIIFVALIAEFLIGMKSGVILVLFDILSLVFGWIIAKNFAHNFSFILASRFDLNQKITSWIRTIIKLPAGTESLPATPENLTNILSSLNVPSFIKDFIMKGDISSASSLLSYITERIASWVLVALSFVILFIVTVVIIRIIGIIVRKAIKVSPFLNWIDILFGGVIKVLISIVVISVVLYAVVYIFNFFNISQGTFIAAVLNSRFYDLSQKALPFVLGAVNKIISGVF